MNTLKLVYCWRIDLAITYLVGIPRSGKSYYAVFYLWKHFVFKPKKTFFSKFVKPKKLKSYTFAYTNINQFDFSKSPKFRKLDFDDLTMKLSILYNLYLSKSSDDVLVEKAKEFDLFDVLIVIDEVHNFLGDKVNDVLKWWLTYHGHLYQDLFFITQDLSLVASQYKNNAEFFYKAIPPSKRLITSRFRYTQYANSRMAMNSKVKDFTLPALKEVFDMYVSGAENKSKSFIQKYLKIAFVLFILLIFLSIYFYNSLEKKYDKKDNVQVNKPIINKKRVINKNVLDTVSNVDLKKEKFEKLVIFKCLDDDCSFKDSHISLNALNVLIKQLDIKPLYVEYNSKTFATLYFLSSKLYMLFGGNTDVKKSNNSHSAKFLSFSK